MRSVARFVGLAGLVSCSSGEPGAREASVAAASLAASKPAAQAPRAKPSKPCLSPLQEAVGPEFRGQPEVERRFQSGLVTQDYKLGEGPAAQVGSRLTVRYAGILENGLVFDDNRPSSTPPFRFRLPERPRVRGWGLGLLGMKAKGLRKITVPAELGYGRTGQRADEGGVSVPPNANLTYVVELLAVEPPPLEPKGPAAFTGPVLARKKRRNGLVTEDFKLGSGPGARLGDRVALHYRGYLPDGSIFDSSISPGAPFQFRLGDRMVIAGWSQGLVGMKPGGLRVLKIPAKLAYGKRGTEGVPPRSDLRFSIELVALRTVAAPKKNGRK